MTSNLAGQPIVAGVDGSPSSLHAAVWAASEAARYHLPVRLVHAVMVSTFAYTAGFCPPSSFYEELDAEGRRYLAEAEATVHREHPDLEIAVDLQHANPAWALIEQSHTARLVVLGSRGLGGISGMLAGSTAVALVAHGHCPVAVIRGRRPDEAPPTDGPVVVGVDGSPASEAAIALAFEEASLRNAELVAAHTWADYSSDITNAWASVSWVGNEQELLAERLAGWQEKYPDVTVRRVVARDRPVRHLLEQGSDAQLLVVGSRGRGGFTGMLLGSTSQALIHHAPCPLLVARPNTAH
ncbi:MAG: universal stress protein [Pseudonocardiales bacterium]|nr:MAG: universal stress protein [Pseudonocardiales bacterium]